MKVEVGMTFGYLKILKLNNSHHLGSSWICECICGKRLKVLKSELVGNSKRLPSKSCGCKYRRQRGLTAKHSDLYQKWGDAIRRCYTTRGKSDINYKDKGITVCEEWRNDFSVFVDWALSSGYEKGLTLDRIDSNGNYEPSNCRWATTFIQAQNKRTPRNNTSGAKGVSKRPSGRYHAYLNRNYKHYNLGTFDTFDEAQEVRNEVEKHYDIHGNLDGHKIFSQPPSTERSNPK